MSTFNLVISNVPGPPRTLYCLGAELKAFYSLGLCYDGAGLFIGLMSYRDRIDFGILGCRDLVPDPWFIADGIGTALDELVRAARATRKGAPSPMPTPETRRGTDSAARSRPVDGGTRCRRTKRKGMQVTSPGCRMYPRA